MDLSTKGFTSEIFGLFMRRVCLDDPLPVMGHFVATSTVTHGCNAQIVGLGSVGRAKSNDRYPGLC